jgi:hypothetical protein
MSSPIVIRPLRCATDPSGSGFEARRVVGSLRERTVFLPAASPRFPREDSISADELNAMASRISEYVDNKLTVQDRYVDTEMMEIQESMSRTNLKTDRVATDLAQLSHLMYGGTRTTYGTPQPPRHPPVVTSLW